MQQASYVHGANETPLIGDTIGNHLDLIAEKYPNRPAVVVRHQNIRLTYNELKNRTDALAEGLLAIGLQPGERIGIWSPNNVEWLLTQFASAKAGLVLVNINPAYRAHELKHVLAKVECAALILTPSSKPAITLKFFAPLFQSLVMRGPAISAQSTYRGCVASFAWGRADDWHV